jgi:hypothetical protein
MPKEPLRPQRPGWRGAGQPSASAKPKHAWQRGTGPESKAVHAGWSIRTKLGFVALASVVLIGGIIWLLYLIRPPRPPLVAVVSGPNAGNPMTPYPAFGPWASQAIETELRPQGETRTVEVAASIASAERPDTWEWWLERCRPTLTQKGASKVVLFLAMAGGVAGDEPYFIPDGADPGNSEHRLTLKLLLDQLGQLEKVPKLVIVDPVQTTNYWPIGAVHNDFVRKLRDQESAIKSVPNLVIICSCDVDQRSWVSDEWGQSAFAHFVLEGMRGAAGSSGRDVTVQGLFDYVRERVHHWARENRDAVQVPIRLGDAKSVLEMEVGLRDPNYQETQLQQNTIALKTCEDLKEEWQFARQQFEAKQHAAWVHAPLLWREYLDRLLRAEEVSRAQVAPDVDELKRLRGKITTTYEEMPNSMAATLAGGKTLRPALTADDEARLASGFKRLWSNPESKPQEYLDLVKADTRQQALESRMVLLSLLLDRATNQSDAPYERASSIAIELGKNTNFVRPAEINFMVMLAEHRKKSNDERIPWEPNPQLIQLALKVRKLAEEAAVGAASNDQWPAYSEQISPWIRNEVEAADKFRRDGEDWLFPTGKEEKAKEALGNAETAYNAVRDKSAHLRHALWVRDTVLTQLPYYGQWAARQKGERAEARLKVVQYLWKQFHQLDRFLRDPQSKTLATKNGQSVPELTADIEKNLDRVKTEFDEEYKPFLRVADQAVQSRWHDIQAVLAVPFIPFENRKTLLEQSLHISHELAKESPFKPGELIKDETAKVGPEALRKEGRRQADLAWATIGDEPQDRGPAFLPESGATVGRHWVDSRKKVKQLADEGRKAATLDGVAASLREAAGGARHLDGAAASSLGRSNPLQDYRHVQLYDLLTWMAKRSLDDYWCRESNQPYFKIAGDDYLANAREQLKLARAEQPPESWYGAVVNLQKLIDKSSKFVANEPGPLNLTDEERYLLTYTLEPPETAPVGTLVYGFEQTGIIAPKEGTSRPTWLYENFVGGKLPPILHSILRPQRPPIEDVSVRKSQVPGNQVLHAYFRGQRIRLDTTVVDHLIPDLRIVQAPGKQGGVRVQRDWTKKKLGNAAIDIVLDASGSMNDLLSGKLSRFEQALNALQKGLQSLPPGVRVGLRIFSDEQDKTAQSRKVPGWDIEKEWGEEELNAVPTKIRELRQLKPYTVTPLVRSMKKAKEEDFPKTFSGRKIMLVLTDGGDTDHKDPASDTLGEEVRKLFKGSEIFVYVIAIDTDNLTDKLEKMNAPRLQKAVESDDVRGKYEKVSSANLGKLLEESLRAKFTVERARDGSKVKTAAITRNEKEENPQWLGLDEDFYRVRPHFGGDISAAGVQVEIRRGDYLAINVFAGGSDFVYKRDVWSRRFAGQPSYKESDDRAAAVPVVKRTERDQLQAMVTLEWNKDVEVRAGTEEGTIKQVRPRLALFGVKPDPKITNFRPVEASLLDAYPAPAWKLEARDWFNDGSNAHLEAWWSEIGSPVEAYAQRPLEFDPKTPNQPLKNPAGWPVVLESIRIEPGAGGGKDLVVRLRYPAEKQYLVRLVSRTGTDLYDHAASEHALYYKAGKYVGRFGGWTEGQFDKPNLDLALELVDVGLFKAEAERAKRFVHFDLKPSGPAAAWPQKVEPPPDR